jgi:hypothetical protein
MRRYGVWLLRSVRNSSPLSKILRAVTDDAFQFLADTVPLDT